MDTLQHIADEVARNLAAQLDAEIVKAIAKRGLPAAAPETVHLYQRQIHADGWQALVYLPDGFEVCRWRQGFALPFVGEIDGNFTVNSGIDFIS